MRGILCRSLRLELVAGLGIALAMASIAAHAQTVPSTTTLTAGALSGCSQALSVTVTANGQPATGTVTIEDNLNGKEVQLAAAALSAQGTASATVSLTDGTHILTAVYFGNAVDLISTSSSVTTAVVTGSCDFTVAAAPAALTLTLLCPLLHSSRCRAQVFPTRPPARLHRRTWRFCPTPRARLPAR